MPPSALLNEGGVSPELALVDPQLATAARSSLPQDDTIARLELLVRAHRIVDARSHVLQHVEVRTPAVVGPAPPLPRAGRRRSAIIAGGAAAAAVASALLVGVRVDLSGQPAGADSSLLPQPPVTQRQPQQTQTQPNQTQPTHTQPSSGLTTPTRTKPAPDSHRAPTQLNGDRHVAKQPRRFVWAPASGVSGYHVQFFRGSKLVFEARTKEPEVTVPRSWTLDGVDRALTPGTYRWNVWAITASGEQSKALVRAELVVGQ